MENIIPNEIAEEVSNPAELENQTETVENDTLETETGAESGASDENRSEETAQDAEPQGTGFGSLFSKARAQAFEKQTAESTAGKTEEESVADPDADDKIPAEGEATEETTDDSAAGDDKETEVQEELAETEKEKKPSRSENYKKVVEERDTALEQVESTTKRLDELENKFEKHGGVESVETAMELFDLASDKTKTDEFVEKINSLPHHAQVQKKIFDNVIDMPENRAYGVNRVLQEDFGLTVPLKTSVMEKLFEVATARLNADAADFESWLDRELLFHEGDEEDQSEVAKLRAEIETLKNPPKTENAQDSAQETESAQDFASRIQRTYNEFEDNTFASVSTAELSKYGFNVGKNDTPEIADAKNYLADAVKFAVGVEMRTAKAHEALLDYWVEDIPKDSSWYIQAEKSYKKAMTVRVQNALKKIAPLLGAVKVPPVTDPANDPKPKTPAKPVAQANPQNQRTNIVPQPKTPEKPKSFKSAFASAKNRAGK